MKILITGGTNGMGNGVAQSLANDDQTHEIIIMSINDSEGKDAVEQLKTCTGNHNISYVVCDLTDFEQVKNVISDLKRKHSFLDRVFINAGIGYAKKQTLTANGNDPHFQVNYLSQFMLLLNILDLLESSKDQGRVIFNATETGEIFWDDVNMFEKWGYERGIHQAMAAKRMLLNMLSRLYRERGNKVAFTGFQISQTVWTNQINIIPKFMKFMATMMKYMGKFITMEECGDIISPLFTSTTDQFEKYAGQFITNRDDDYHILSEDEHILNQKDQERLWNLSLEMINDEKTYALANKLFKREV